MSKHILVGTPMEIGAQVFTKFCIPAVREVSNHASPQELAQLYSGILSAAMGSMLADFGHEQARSIAQTMVDAFAVMEVDPSTKRQ